MPVTVETICVDIGNSGMRCIRLRWPTDSAASVPRNHSTRVQATGTDDVPWEGEVLRVDWPSGTAATDVYGRDENAATALLVRTLTPWLQSVSGTFERRWLVSSVQRNMEAHLRRSAETLGAAAYRLVNYQDLHLNMAVEVPEQVGIDRLLAASAALDHFPGQRLIVIQAGSAITVDLVEPPRHYCGGAIMPGVPMMLRLLSRGADMLPEVAAGELLDLPALPGRNTTAAMTVGTSSAVVGGVQHLVARYRAQYGQRVPVVLSGGDGPRLTPHIAAPVHIIDHLVLRGLASLKTEGIRFDQTAD